MEQPDSRCCGVRELDLTLQPHVIPRYKTRLPLATQQLRLRSLIQVIGHNLRRDGKEKRFWFYFTLHRTSMSSPLYTSEAVNNANPKWATLDSSTLRATGHSAANEVVLRLWNRVIKDNILSDTVVFAWGISLTGLSYIGPKLPNNLKTILRDNSLIFHIHGGYYAPPFCFTIDPDYKRYLVMAINATEVRDSYSVSKLSNLRSKMQALKQQTDAAASLKERIASGNTVSFPKYQQSTLSRLYQPQIVNQEKKFEIQRIRKDLEIAKFRAKLLEQERVRKMTEVRLLNQSHIDISEANTDHGSDLMARYRELHKDIERLNEWRQNHIDLRETYLHKTACLAYRRRQLISELNAIYPINKEQEDKYTINNVHLPDSEKLSSSNDTHVAVALGYVAHTTQMIANFLNVPTRYPIIHYGSRSKIIDHINENLPDSDREFPLFARTKDKLQFHYAVYLMNKNIAQLRWYCGLPTSDLRSTLLNLSGLISTQSSHVLDSTKRTLSGSSLDVTMEMNKFSLPYKPVPKLLSEKHHRSSKSISQFKGPKTQLGSSLDQGLDQSMLPQFLTQCKRICKSEESAIDDSALAGTEQRHIASSCETFTKSKFETVRDTTDTLYDSAKEADDTMPVANDIEIMTPMSVSKPKVDLECRKNSIPVRQRSSNSVSSCEMALGGSLIDGEDSLNGHCITKNDDDNVLKSKEGGFDDNDSLVIQHSGDFLNKDNRDEGQSINVPSEEQILLQNSLYNAVSMMVQETILQTTHKNDNSGVSQKYSNETACDTSVEDRISDIKDQANQITTSSEYMNSIRRSSENVYARTEALANKTTSFKVMRPRL
ncbi:hypothetical protein QAD02_017309 [Eretmocerus hayati]|uniref:Uncharacterized protein n=1 Tax=Eretmocerus hayati TaxID=131215 RepID=A0ACC2PDX9_9HYME|nr:hypothetical protein QAD02_017309 [Eretmocerus hayati]